MPQNLSKHFPTPDLWVWKYCCSKYPCAFMFVHKWNYNCKNTKRIIGSKDKYGISLWLDYPSKIFTTSIYCTECSSSHMPVPIIFTQYPGNKILLRYKVNVEKHTNYNCIVKLIIPKWNCFQGQKQNISGTPESPALVLFLFTSVLPKGDQYLTFNTIS